MSHSVKIYNTCIGCPQCVRAKKKTSISKIAKKREF